MPRVNGRAVQEPQTVADLRRDFAEILAPYEKELRVQERARLQRDLAAEDKRLHDWYVNFERS